MRQRFVFDRVQFTAKSGRTIDPGSAASLLGGPGCWAAGVNNSTQVVGTGGTNFGCYHPFFWSSSTGLKDLGTLGGFNGWGYGISNSGQVVGQAANGAENYRAFLWSTGTGMQDLNFMIPSNSGWTLEAAYAVNDSGQIVGWGTNPSGRADAFLLTPFPTPEPTTLVLLGVGGISLFGLAWRRKRPLGT